MPFDKNEIKVLLRHEARDRMPTKVKRLPRSAVRAKLISPEFPAQGFVLKLPDVDIALMYDTLGEIAGDWLWYQPLETPQILDIKHS